MEQPAKQEAARILVDLLDVAIGPTFGQNLQYPLWENGFFLSSTSPCDLSFLFFFLLLFLAFSFFDERRTRTAASNHHYECV